MYGTLDSTAAGARKKDIYKTFVQCNHRVVTGLFVVVAKMSVLIQIIMKFMCTRQGNI